ncbi:MAG: hypothetical protein CSA96_05725 [Bacteroidetes bacterium]|nr:MAG: hypothetical protein CSA96_05725 [Bacteroidota bacterium]
MIRHLKAGLILLLAFQWPQLSAWQAEDPAAYVHPLAAAMSCYDLHYYDIALRVDHKSTYLEGQLTMQFSVRSEMDSLVLELQDGLEVDAAGIASRAAYPAFEDVELRRYGDVMSIVLPESLAAGEMAWARISYKGDAGRSSGFFAGISNAKDRRWGFDVTYTLSEPQNAKDWLPVKQILADKIDSLSMHLECDQGLMAGSNGVLTGVEETGRNTLIYHWESRYPIAYYLISFAVADYRMLSFNARCGEGDSVLVQSFIYNLDDAQIQQEADIRVTAELIRLFSEKLTPYPFADEKYGYCQAPMGGGMEHQTMTTIDNFGFYLVAHELAHQWFGDHVTCGNWQDIWINEGFASYMEYVAGQELQGQADADEWMNNAMSLAKAEKLGSVFVPEDGVEHTSRLFNYGLSYKKGAILLHMIRYRLNSDSLFFHILASYLQDFGGGVASGEEFSAFLEAESGLDFKDFFKEWYYGEGYPQFELKWVQRGDSLHIYSEQSGTAPNVTPFFHTDFDIELLFEDGRTERIRLLQDQPCIEHALKVNGIVSSITFDPDGWLLKRATVIALLPGERPYAFGPNPVRDEMRIRFFNQASIDEIQLTGMGGKEIIHIGDAANPCIIDLSSLPNGPYILLLKNNAEAYQEKIIKISPR